MRDIGTEQGITAMLEAICLSPEQRGQSDYAAFLERKSQIGSMEGFAPTCMPDFLFDFQSALVDWSVRKGRAAIFADCGLGKTPLQLVWSQNVIEHMNKPVLVLTPLAVSFQTIHEAEKFNIDAVRSGDGTFTGTRIVVTNYERLHYFNPNDFAGVVADESGILKSFEGVTRKAVTEFMRKMPYRLLCTATPSPNDFIELGTSSEALGELGHMDMLSRFFKNNNNTADVKGHWKGHGAPRMWEQKQWRFKGHAELPFWQWVCSWARAIRKPSDLGFDDARFVLPPLIEREHLIENMAAPEGMLFTLPAVGLTEQRAERRRTLDQRCEKASELVNPTGKPALVWCHLNPEGDLLEKLIPDAIQVSGKDSDEVKEEKFLAFVSGQARVLITKPKIGAWGLNLQHCAHETFFPSHSYEQYYQGVRRCYRFGQTQPVIVDIITTPGEQNVLKNLQRKSAQADRQFAMLVNEMNKAAHVTRDIPFTQQSTVPSWLTQGTL